MIVNDYVGGGGVKAIGDIIQAIVANGESVNAGEFVGLLNSINAGAQIFDVPGLPNPAMAASVAQLNDTTVIITSQMNGGMLGCAVVLKIIDGVFSLGTPVVIETTKNFDEIKVARINQTTAIVISNKNNMYSEKGRIKALSVSGTSITVGSFTEFGAGNSLTDVCYLSENKACILYRDSFLAVVTLTGATTLSIGNDLILTGGNLYRGRITALTPTDVVVSASNWETNHDDQAKIRVWKCTVTGTNVSQNTYSDITTLYGAQSKSIVPIGGQRVAVYAASSGPECDLRLFVCDVTNSSVSVLQQRVIASPTKYYPGAELAIYSSRRLFVGAYTDENNALYVQSYELSAVGIFPNIPVVVGSTADYPYAVGFIALSETKYVLIYPMTASPYLRLLSIDLSKTAGVWNSNNYVTVGMAKNKGDFGSQINVYVPK
ncbi:MAG: hypothetical protein RR893_12825 [Clostridia bacterium]